MGLHEIKKGLELPISGAPVQEIRDGAKISQVALLGHDYPTMKPRLHVTVGDKVKRGQLLFEDRKSEGVCFTAPAAGEVTAVNRGEKRVFQSLVIKLSDGEKKGKPGDGEVVEFKSYKGTSIDSLDGDAVRDLLSESGLWTSLRTRPYSRIPSTTDTCAALFVTAIDTAPLSASVETVLKGNEKDFVDGLKVLSHLTDGKLFLCVGKDWNIDTKGVKNLQKEEFRGLHPAGLVGTHIHTLMPVSRKRVVWHIGYQDVVAVGKLFKTGKLSVERVVSVAGPAVSKPGLIRTRLGASLQELTNKEIKDKSEVRTVSGSVLYGQTATDDVFGYLNRYHNQVSCLEEDRERVFMGWLMPGGDKFSTIRAFLSKWIPGKEKKAYDFKTTNNGSHRAMVPIGMYERVMPLDILPTFLLRSVLVGDLEKSEQLGCLELDEEDVALCSFVCPGKEDYGKALRKVLNQIWQEG